jgi:hypothetical protein
MTGPGRGTSKPRRQNGAGTVFLICGLSFLGVGIGTRQTAFLTLGPTFLVLGIALMARGHRARR